MGRYRAYRDYQDVPADWLGRIPTTWQAARLGRHFEERCEKVSDKDFQPLSVTMRGVVPQLDTAAKTDAGDNRKKVCHGDFVINSRSDRKGSSGVSQLGGSVSLISIVLKPRNIDPAFVHYLLRSQPFQEEFYRYGKGIVADLWSTNYSEMKNILLPIPTIDEQNSIASFLDHETAKIDRLIARQERLIELLKEKRQAVISHAVTKGLNPDAPMKDSGVEWLGEAPAHWTVSKFRYVFQVDNNLRTPIDIETRSEMAGEYPYYGPTGILSFIDRYVVEGEYFLISEDGDHFTKYRDKPMTISVQGKFSVNNHAHLVKGTTGCATSWGCLFFEHADLFPWIIKQGVGRYKLRKESLVEIPVLVPPLSEQLSIVAAIGEKKILFDAAISKARSFITLLQEHRSALISAAVTGKIDVRGWQKPNTEPQEAAAAVSA